MMYTFYPSLNILLLLILTLYLMNIMKSNLSSFMLYLTLIIFSTGILLLLFYMSMINDKYLYNKLILVLTGYYLVFPNIYLNLNYKKTFMSNGLELLYSKNYLFIYFSLMIILIILFILSKNFYFMKFLRQIY